MTKKMKFNDEVCATTAELCHFMSTLFTLSLVHVNVELKRLINSTKDVSRRAALERSLDELNNRNTVGNDTILTSDFSSSSLSRVCLYV